MHFLATHLLYPPITKHWQHHSGPIDVGLKIYRHRRRLRTKHRRKPGSRRLQESSLSATARDHQRLGVLAKTLELSNEGVIMPRSVLLKDSSDVTSLLRYGEVASASMMESQRFASESCSGHTYQTLLRHRRVCSVRVTVEPQVIVSNFRNINKERWCIFLLTNSFLLCRLRFL